MDNYAEFIERIDAASARLGTRRTSLTTTLGILVSLFEQNNTGFQLWNQRRIHADKLLANHTGKPEAYRTLSELSDVALKMEPMFRKRTQRLKERVAVVRERSEEIDRSLNELKRSKLKLETSRVLSQERENLRKAVADLAGTPEVPVVAGTDPGLRGDLDDAREAILLAEALLEVKGH